MPTNPAPSGSATTAIAGRFTITALRPPEHTWDVYIDAPATADVAVRIRTWYGQPLRVLDTTHDPTSCDVKGARSVRSLAFPRLEAQRPGEWTVIVTKRLNAYKTADRVRARRRWRRDWDENGY